MEPNTIEESIKGLLEAIKESPEYLEFQKQSDILKKKPELRHVWIHSGQIIIKSRMNVIPIICLKL
ncbi:MAG: hypothetical protein ACLUGJ_12565 [Blautia wexlerae]